MRWRNHRTFHVAVSHRFARQLTMNEWILLSFKCSTLFQIGCRFIAKQMQGIPITPIIFFSWLGANLAYRTFELLIIFFFCWCYYLTNFFLKHISYVQWGVVYFHFHFHFTNYLSIHIELWSSSRWNDQIENETLRLRVKLQKGFVNHFPRVRRENCIYGKARLISRTRSLWIRQLNTAIWR